MIDFDDYLKNNMPINGGYSAQELYEAGQQSQQAKIDELQRKIAFQEKAIKNIKLQFENKQIDCDRSDRKINELKKKLDCCREENRAHLEKIDDALNALCKLQYSSGERIYNDVGSILKGEE